MLSLFSIKEFVFFLGILMILVKIWLYIWKKKWQIYIWKYKTHFFKIKYSLHGWGNKKISLYMPSVWLCECVLCRIVGSIAHLCNDKVWCLLTLKRARNINQTTCLLTLERARNIGQTTLLLAFGCPKTNIWVAFMLHTTRFASTFLFYTLLIIACKNNLLTFELLWVWRSMSTILWLLFNHGYTPHGALQVWFL